MDTKEFTESKYITVQLVKDSPTKRCVILTDTEVEESNFEGKIQKKLAFDVEIDGKNKRYSPNRTTLENMQEKAGMESKAWIGKVLILQILKAKGKEMVISNIE